jgi:two-component system cell cycle sensor histidine kinase/response regulator CckA
MMTKPKTILVIDDEESQRETLSDILSRAGFRVLTGGGYADGVSLYQQYGPEIALLLVDVSLPQANGFELAKALCGIEPGLRVLFMSGGVGAELCRYYGVSAATAGNLLSKPVASGALLRKIRQLLGLN